MLFRSRYGVYKSEEKVANDVTIRNYQKGDFYIIITFKNNVAVKITYRKEIGYSGMPAEISPDEIRKLLDANSNGHKWTELDILKKVVETDDVLERKKLSDLAVRTIGWKRNDEKVWAFYDNELHGLNIGRIDYLEIEKNDKTDGF